MIRDLKDAGVKIQPELGKDNDMPLSGLTFVFTGAMERWSRPEAEALIVSMGGNASSSVGKKVDFVVVG